MELCKANHWLSYLNSCAPSRKEMRYEQDNRDHKQQMDRSEGHVERDKSEQPQHKQYAGYGS